MLFYPELVLNTCTLLFLSWCAVVDVRHRQIKNATWLAGGLVLLPIRVWVEVASRPGWPAIWWAVALTVAAFVMWMARLWGGADAKGAILIAWMVPPFTIGPVTSHALLYAVTVSFIAILAWYRFRNDPAPFYAFLAPSMAATFIVLGLLW